MGKGPAFFRSAFIVSRFGGWKITLLVEITMLGRSQSNPETGHPHLRTLSGYLKPMMQPLDALGSCPVGIFRPGSHSGNPCHRSIGGNPCIIELKVDFEVDH